MNSKVDIKLFNNKLSVTTDVKKSIFALKKIHLSIPKVYNQLILLRKCRFHNIIPVSFLLKLPFKSKNTNTLRKKFGNCLLNEQIAQLQYKLKSLREHEIRTRCQIVMQIYPRDWMVIWNYITVLERKVFFQSKVNCINKFSNLAKTQHLQTNNNKCAPANRIVNLSDRSLSPSELSLLSKGLSFVPFTNKFNRFDIAAQTEYTSKRNQLPSLPHLVKSSLSNKNVGTQNLTALELKALKDLQGDNNIVIQTSDKGKVVVVLNKTDYVAKLEGIIFSNAYVKLSADPTEDINKLLDKLFRDSKKRKALLPLNISTKLRGGYFRHPSIYGQVKVHKSDKPLRPIVTNYNTILEKAAKYLANILKFYTDSFPLKSTVKNTSELLNNIRNLPYNPSCILVSFDVVNLFGSINLDECIEVVTDLILATPDFEAEFEIDKVFVIELCKICINESYFMYEGDYYRQKNGVPMGSPLSPVLADLVMMKLELSIMDLDLAKHLLLWNRYVDDVLSLWLGNLIELIEFLVMINTLNPHINFTMETECNNSLPFLDISISKHDSEFRTQMYCKPTDSGILTNFKSFHPPQIKGNIVKNQIDRVIRNSQNISNDIKDLENKLADNDFPKNFVRNNISAAKRQHEQTDKKTQDQTASNEPYLVLPYMGRITKKLKKDTKKLNLRLVSKSNSSLGDIFRNSFKYDTNIDAGVIYKINCSCGKFYIGETGRHISTRVKEHKNAVRDGNKYNGLGCHIFYNFDHSIDWKNVEILAREGNVNTRKIKEAMFIVKYKPELNLNEGIKLLESWNDCVPNLKGSKN